MAVATITTIGIGMGALTARTLYQTGLWQPTHWQLPNPRRQAILMGAIMGRNWGAGLRLTLSVLALSHYPRPR